jgi:hypothetical protein
MKQTSLVVITVLSWALFPLMLKYLNLNGIKIFVFFIIFCISFVIYFKSKTKQFLITQWQKLIIGCWIGYLLALLMASWLSKSNYSLVQWSLLFGKFLFLIFLIKNIDEKYIVSTLKIYANIMVISVVLALISVLIVLLGIQPIQKVDMGGRLVDMYFGSYYVLNTPLCAPYPIYRIQGLSEEPGTFAFTLLPAFYWFLIVQKSYVRLSVLMLGLILSSSMGVLLLLLALLPILTWKYIKEKFIIAFYLMTICSMIFIMILSNNCSHNNINKKEDISILKSGLGSGATEDYIENFNNKDKIKKEKIIDNLKENIKYSTGTTLEGKIQSFNDRKIGVILVFNYFKDNILGTGAALGMGTIKNSISVGYFVAFLEAGVVGGILYLTLFLILGWLSLRIIITLKDDSFEAQVAIVTALSVVSIIVMGAQRIQPDLSLWHMCFYAMLFYYLSKLSTIPNMFGKALVIGNDSV